VTGVIGEVGEGMKVEADFKIEPVPLEGIPLEFQQDGFPCYCW